MAFVHLHCRSYFSLKDGAFSPESLAVRAAELGMPAVALTDSDSLTGVARFVTACRDLGVKPILGAQLTVSSFAGDGRPCRRRSSGAGRSSTNWIVVVAKDDLGYANLCRLITAAHAKERGNPWLWPGEIWGRTEGLVCLLGPESEPGMLAVAGLAGAAREAARSFREAFGDDCFIEVRNHLEMGSRSELRRLLRLAEEGRLPAVATNAVRYLVSGDAFLADALECMREIVPVAPHHVTRRNAEGYLKSPREMRMLFADRPDLLRNTLRIAEACDVDLGLGSVHFPEFPTPRGRSATSVLAERCHEGIRRRGVHLTPDVRGRLDHELDQIRRMGYSGYFLTVADIVAEVKAMGIRCACRGSAAGSLVCYAIEISEVDPIRHGLLFERFLNPLRDELPDIDLDVESARREEVYDAILARYGEERCACVAMIDTYRARSAIRESGKALGYPDGEVDRVSKAFPHIGAGKIREAIRDLPELRGSNLAAGQLETLFRVAERLNGFPRHIALHPSGIVLSGKDLPDRAPVEPSFGGYRMVQADKDDVEVLGLLKLDVLGVRMLSAMRHALDEIERTTGERADLDRIPNDDPATYELIRASRTIGCFQIESPGQRELLQKFQPDRFEDLIIDISLFRPGPVKSDMVAPFLNRRHGFERPRYAHPSLKPILQETHGVIVYHEQVMRVLAASGCSLAEADRIRRHLDDDGEIDSLHRNFLYRVTARGLGADDAEKVWRELASFASFGFCKAHAAAFAVPTYQSAWLKSHYPAHFLAGVLTHEPGMYPRRLILEDAREHGIAILPLDINASQRDYTVEPAPDLVKARQTTPPSPPRNATLASSAHPAWLVTHGSRLWTGETARGAERNIPQTTPVSDGSFDVPGVVEDVERSSRAGSPGWVRATSPPPGWEWSAGSPGRESGWGIRLGLRDVYGISDDEIGEILGKRPFASVGDFIRRARVSRPVTEALAHAGAFDELKSGTRRDRLFLAMTAESPWEGEQLALSLAGEPLPPGLREYTDGERVRAELEVLGVDASRHLISFYEPLLADLGAVRSRDLSRHRGGERVTVAGVKVASQTPAVRSGQRIIFLTLDDATGPVDVTVFERAQERCARVVFHSSLLAIRGRLRRTGVKGVSIVAEAAWDLPVLDAARREGRLADALRGGRPGPVDVHVPARKFWHASGGSSGW
ncbi:MAG: DNA polymerase III subunit alpha [Actinomycetota bacterium]